jgi:hypothetical protein
MPTSLAARPVQTLAVLSASLLLALRGMAQSTHAPTSEENRALTAEMLADSASRAAELGGSAEHAKAQAATFHDHIAFLADPKLKGRVAGSDENRIAADYIERHFRDAHLGPVAIAGAPASYRQTFRCGEETKVVEHEMTIAGAAPARPNDDFVVLGLSGNAQVTAPVVFVGYSINDATNGYMSYPPNADLSGTIALIYRFEPMDEHGKGLWTKGNGWSPSASLDDKVAAAAERHAAGVILVNPPDVDDVRAKSLIGTRESLPFKKDAGIPVVMATLDAIAPLLKDARDPQGAPITPKSLRALADRPDLRSALLDFPADRKVTLRTRLSHENLTTDNVLGVLPGRGALANQWLVIGAHYDHVGTGPIGVMPANQGKIHPGADDNASGSAGLMLLADLLSKDAAASPADRPARSILFCAFSAEESGLDGSRFLVNNPPIPLESIDLMLNMDMIGRLRKDVLEIDGTESAIGLYDQIKPLFDASGLDIKHGSNIATNSDHHAFYMKNIPVLFFFTGLHREYHTPQDTIDTINAEGGAKVIDLVHAIAQQEVSRDARLAFTKPTRTADDQQPKPGPTRTRVRFGVAPASYADDKPGVEVGDVYEGTPAAEAGVKVGDRLIKWNGQEIRTVEDWMPMLSAGKPGDVVDVTLLRGGKEVVLKVTLKARDSNGK